MGPARARESPIGEAALLIRSDDSSDVFLLCDHASRRIPPEYGDLGVGPDQRSGHVAWDIGAAQVTRVLAHELGATAVLGATSRLVVDLNRATDSGDLMPAWTHGVHVPGNEDLPAKERESRLRRFYWPYHETIDRFLSTSPASVVVTVHSFSHSLDHARRDFDVGVLFDEFEAIADEFINELEAVGLSARPNEPYSGRSHVVTSAQTHGRRYGRVYFEIEINQRLLARQLDAARMGRRLAPVFKRVGTAARNLSGAPGRV